MEWATKNKLGIAVFDFRASGYSNGKYVSLGWYEALDLNEVCLFLKKEALARKICLWGRSMGASAITFFLSPKYRFIMNRIFNKKRYKKIEWVSPLQIDLVVLDSCFTKLTKSIHNMVNSKTDKIP